MKNGAALRAQFAAALASYLERADEAALSRAYELGRWALETGKGILDLAEIQREALLRALTEGRADPACRRIVDAAGAFFAESLSPFEMTHRGAKEANTALRHFNEVHEMEIRRIAHLLHAETGQSLTATRLALSEMEREIGCAAHAGFVRVGKLLDEVEEQMRHLSHELRPTILDDLGLVPAIEFLGEGLQSRTGIHVSVAGSTGQRFSQAIETALYRIAQEAFNNIAKHAKASIVEVDVRVENALLQCSIKDDGLGFDPPTVFSQRGERGLGLMGMSERCHQIGGTFRIDSAPGQGTEVLVTIPIRR